MVVKKRGTGIFKKNRLGLSTIIITLVLTLISLVAIVIVWNVVKSLIEKQAEITTAQNKFLSEEVSIKGVYYNEPFMNITLKRPAGEIRMSIINTTTVEITPMDADVFSVADLSGSMAGDKLTETQNANANIIPTILNLGNSRMGFVGYNNTVIDSGSTFLTRDSDLLNNTVNSWSAVGHTCICCGINNASANLQLQSASGKLKSIIVMSDGEANIECSQQNTGDAKQDAIQAACSANATLNSGLNNFVIYTIGVGDTADAATLSSIADCGGGKYFPVANLSDLQAIYQGIAQQIVKKTESFTSLNYFSVVFYNATNSYAENIYEIPDILQTKTYNFNLGGELSGTIIRIEIYPIIIISDKQQVTGPLMDYWVPN